MAIASPMLAYPSPRTLTNDSRTSTDIASKFDVESTNGDPESPFTPRQRSRGLTQSHRKLVFTDPVAFRYLEEDESTIVIDRRRRLEGYELYAVEQWACSRVHPTFIICTHTGDPSRSILVNVLAVPNDETAWSRRLKIYFGAVSQSYAREKETQFGTIMVTNLSGFPSSLTVVAIPDGDVRKHREDFIVNENLKRMGCSGRAGLSLSYPQASTVNKFHHLYHTSERVPLYSSVMEIVRFCQTALVLYGKLQPTYADGLLCDITETAISEWWNDIGTDFHNVEPSDGILGPTTVSALIGLMIGAYNRLKEAGSPVGKDPMDLSSMKRAVGHFQRSSKMEKTRRLDRETLDRLHRATAKSAADEGFRLTGAIKSTIGELSGKGGEMIARGFGGGREKAGIAEVETLDIDRLSQLVTGPKMRWLWQGKEMKSASNALFGAPTDELNGRVFSTDEQGNFIWTSSDPAPIPEESSLEPLESKRPKQHTMRANSIRFGEDEPANHSSLTVPGPPQSYEHSRKQSSAQNRMRRLPALNMALADGDANGAQSEAESKKGSEEREKPPPIDIDRSNHRAALRGLDNKGRDSPTKQKERRELENFRQTMKNKTYQDFSANLNMAQPHAKGLRRSLSAVQLRDTAEERKARIPRQLSFSIVAEPIFRRHYDNENPQLRDQDSNASPLAQVKSRRFDLMWAQSLASKVLAMERGLIPFSHSKVESVERLDDEAQLHLEELNNIYYQHLEEYQTLQATSTDLLAREKSALNEGMRRIEMLGQKLDYELGTLQSRMQEVEEGVVDFERSVLDIEATIKALVEEPDQKRSVPWFRRLMNFWGNSPRIAAAPRRGSL